MEHTNEGANGVKRLPSSVDPLQWEVMESSKIYIIQKAYLVVGARKCVQDICQGHCNESL